jgi:hypothetical protein
VTTDDDSTSDGDMMQTPAPDRDGDGAGGATSPPEPSDDVVTEPSEDAEDDPPDAAGGGAAGGTAEIPACDGFGVAMGATACRIGADCTVPDTACSNDYTGPSPCGAGCAPINVCTTDIDCGDDASCVAYPNACCEQLGQPETDTLCVPHCTETSCAPEEECGEDGLCVPRNCSPGDCELNRECNMTTRRCEWKTCASTSDCDCGFCAGRCYNGPGTCLFITGG